MVFSEEILKKIFSLFGDNSEVMALINAKDINGLWWYVHWEVSKYRIPVLDSMDIVDACEKLDFKKLEKLYSEACTHLKYKKPLDIEEEIRFHKETYPNASEDELKRYIESIKQDESNEEAFLREVIAAFKSLNLQGIYTKAKRYEDIISLLYDLRELQDLNKTVEKR